MQHLGLSTDYLRFAFAGRNPCKVLAASRSFAVRDETYDDIGAVS